MRATWSVVIGLLAALLAGCGQPDAPVDAAPATEAATPALPPPVPELPRDDAGLQALADGAMRGRQLFAPAGANALEYFLALRERPAHAEAATTALVQLQPYLTMGIEHALQAGHAAEAERLTALLARADPAAPALPRLREAVAALDATQQAAAQVTAAAAAAANRPSIPAPPSPPTPAAAAGTVVEPAPPAAAMPAPVAAPPAPPVVASTTPPRPPKRQPMLLTDVAPRYPLPALRGRIEGQVELAFAVMPDGSVRDVRLVDAEPAGVFDASALAVASRWQFEATGEHHTVRRVLRYRLPAGS